MSERSENGRGGQVRAARQKGRGATNFDLNTGRYGQFSNMKQSVLVVKKKQRWGLLKKC
jgi:hypothetical protein